MGRAPCCDKANVKKGPWAPEEDAKLKDYIEKNGTGGNWIALPQKAGLKRCGKSCRLRWLNYLRPNIKHGEFSDDEDRIICSLYANIGSRWSIIAAQLPGRTDNDIKNYWNTKLKKKLMGMIAPAHHQIRKPTNQGSSFTSLLQAASLPSSPTTPLSSSSYKYSNNTYCNQARSFTEPFSSFSSPPLSFTTASPSLLQSQETFLSPIQHYQLKDSTPVFGGDQASCNSSDGSSNNHAKEQEYEYAGNSTSTAANNTESLLSFHSLLCDGVEDNNNQKSMLSNGNGWNTTDQKQNGLWGDNSIDYGLDEIKQLICSTGTSSNILFDENKTAKERLMYY